MFNTFEKVLSNNAIVVEDIRTGEIAWVDVNKPRITFKNNNDEEYAREIEGYLQRHEVGFWISEDIERAFKRAIEVLREKR